MAIHSFASRTTSARARAAPNPTRTRYNRRTVRPRKPDLAPASPPITIERHLAPTRDGWHLELKRTVAPACLDAGLRPLLIIPGYGMNAFIFGFHPRGTSMERCFAEAGFEVWSGNLRRQGGSRPARPSAPGPSLRAYAEADLAALVDGVLSRTATRADRVDLIGASLGGSIAYAYLVLRRDHRVGAMVAMGAPLRWSNVHPALRLAFSSPAAVGLLRLQGTRRIARMGMGLLERFPGLLSIYMNPAHVDLSAAGEMVETVEDPWPRVNQDIARWIRDRDMVLARTNVTHALGHVDLPLLVVVSNRDGIVPEAAALSVIGAWGGRDVEVLRIGDEREWFAHADLFIAHDAPARVFTPIARWLAARRDGPGAPPETVEEG